MINLKRIDDKDFVFINKIFTEKEEKEFSDFLKKRNIKAKRKLPAKSKQKKTPA